MLCFSPVARFANTLTTALTSAELMLHAGKGGKFRPDLANAIIRAVRRADQMLRDLLDVTRIAAGNPLPLNVSALDLAVLADQVVSELERCSRQSTSIAER